MALALAFVAALNQASCSTPCEGICLGPTDAVFYLSCPSADLTAVNLSGPCATGQDASAPAAHNFSGDTLSLVTGYAGVCHVELTFSNGFVYSTDINFQRQPSEHCGCSPRAVPTPRTVMVPNPPDTCGDASAGASDAAAGDSEGGGG